MLSVMALSAMASCTKYNIIGSSDLSYVDGRMLFLRPLSADGPKGIDSCDVVHGKFKFNGHLDSVQVVMLCLDNDAVIPVVLEDGQISVEVNTQKQVATGTPLNDSLTAFNTRYHQLILQMQDLQHQENQAYMNAEDMSEVNVRLAKAQQQLLMQEDRLVSTFIADNFDNCLGPYVFLLATQSYQYPVLMPWIEALMTKATPTFKNNPLVAEYMRMAQHNQDVMSGVADVPSQTMSQPSLDDGPTPAEMGTPQEEE